MIEYVTSYEDFKTTDHIKYTLPIEKCEEIVRCRDCKYYESVPEDSGDWCGYWTDRVYRTDGFCAWGERKVDK